MSEESIFPLPDGSSEPEEVDAFQQELDDALRGVLDRHKTHGIVRAWVLILDLESAEIPGGTFTARFNQNGLSYNWIRGMLIHGAEV